MATLEINDLMPWSFFSHTITMKLDFGMPLTPLHFTHGQSWCSKLFHNYDSCNAIYTYVFISAQPFKIMQNLSLPK